MLNTWYTDERRPHFCTFCAKPLEEKEYDKGYNEFTGERNTQEYLVCPEANLDYTRHDAWEVIKVEDPFTFTQQVSYKS